MRETWVMRYAFRYGVFKPLLMSMGMGPTFSFVEVTPYEVKVEMGWTFRTTIPRRSIVRCEHYPGTVVSIGVHGWMGTWLVNGASSGLVKVEIDPPARAKVMFIPVALRRLIVSLEQPDEFLAAMA